MEAQLLILTCDVQWNAYPFQMGVLERLWNGGTFHPFHAERLWNDFRQLSDEKQKNAERLWNDFKNRNSPFHSPRSLERGWRVEPVPAQTAEVTL
jgi:hypothetical protein